jgi:protein SCO1
MRKFSALKSNVLILTSYVLRLTSYVLCLITIAISLSSCQTEPDLLIYGPRDVSEQGDTIYHTIPPFALTNQEDELFSLKNLEGKVYVAEFFFTTCPSICPIMNRQMKRLQELISEVKNFHLVSFSVDPNHDTPEVLKAYGENLGADFSNWTFLTGSPEEIYDIGFQGYFINAMEDELAPGGFLHSEFFILVDQNGRIRGYYDGTNPEEIDKLADDVKKLLK